MSDCQSASVSPGKPYIRSMLRLRMPAERRIDTASMACLAVWRRWRKCRRWSSKVCTPIEMRLMGSCDNIAANSTVTSSGFTSMVTSVVRGETSEVREYTLFIYIKSWCNCSKVNWLGVPPPIYIVESGKWKVEREYPCARFLSLRLSLSSFLFPLSSNLNSISRQRASTYLWRRSRAVVE